MEERDFLLGIKGKIEEYREAQKRAQVDDLSAWNTNLNVDTKYRNNVVAREDAENNSELEEFWMKKLEKVRGYSDRKDIIEKIKEIRQQRVDEIKEEISSFKESFIKEIEEKQEEIRRQVKKKDYRKRYLKGQERKLEGVKKDFSKESITYKAAEEEQKQTIKKQEALIREIDDMNLEVNNLEQQKIDFLERYDGIDFSTEAGIDKLEEIIDEIEAETLKAEAEVQKSQKEKEAEAEAKELMKKIMKEKMMEKEQAIAETEAMMSKVEKAEEEEARKLEEEIMKKRLKGKNGTNMPPQKPTQDVPPTQGKPSKEPLSRRDEIERGYTTRITIGRNATIQIGNNIINVKNKVVKDGVTLNIGDVKLSLESVGIDTVGIIKLIENGTIDSVVINVLNTLSEEDRKKAITDYVNGFTKGSTPLKVTYDQDDLSKTSFLGRLFKREVNVPERNHLLTRARELSRYGNIEVVGKYKPNDNWKQRIISKWFTKEKPKEIPPAIPTLEEETAAFVYNELLSKGELSKVENYEGRTNIRKAYKLSDEQMIEFNSLYKEQERQNASKQPRKDQVEPEELEH